MRNRSYSDAIRLKTFQERFDYLKLDGRIGEETFGYDRWLNQKLYGSSEWKAVKRGIIIRDCGCDLAVEGREILDGIVVHHLNPITKDDVINRSPELFSPENLICVSALTHRALHYGSFDLLPKKFVERAPNDTCPWKKKGG